jgi:hypothetical protein
VERNTDGAERIRGECNVDVYGGTSGDVHYAGAGDADAGRNCVYGDAGQRNGRDVQFHDSGNGRDADECHTDGDADGDDSGAGLYDCGDGDSEFDRGESERNMERDADDGERIQRECAPDV